MQGELMVRQLAAGEGAAYRAIRLETLQREPAYFGALFEEEAGRDPAWFEAVLAGESVFCAERAGAIVGVARLRGYPGRKERHKAGVHGVYVRASARGLGAGRALLDAAIAAARGRYEHLNLTVAAENAAAIGLYRSLGFVTFGVEERARSWAGRYTDVMSMVLRLSPVDEAPRKVPAS